MHVLLSLNVKKWHLRLSIVHFVVALVYHLLLAGFEVSDMIGYNFAFHMFYWFFQIIPHFCKLIFEPVKYWFLRIALMFFVIIFSFFGLVVMFYGLYFVVVYWETFPPFTISFAILLGTTSLLQVRNKLPYAR